MPKLNFAKSTIVLAMLTCMAAAPLRAQDSSSKLELGQIALAGNACASTISAPELTEDKLSLPVGLNVKRDASEKLKRGTCTMSLPIQLAQGHRLVLSNISASGLVNLKKGGTSRISLELFKAGEHGEVLQVGHDATQKKVRELVDLHDEGDIIISQCGEGLNLRANLSATLIGTGRSTVRMDLIEADVRIEECQ